MRRTALLAVAVAVSACGTGGGEPASAPEPERELVAHVASYDLSAGMDRRFIVGLMTGDRRFVGGGTVDLRFAFLGAERAEGKPEPAGEATADFLPLPDSTDPGTERPSVGTAAETRGVYRVASMTFDRPGIYEVEVTADLGDGDVRSGTAAFQVLPEPRVPAPGDRAPRTENLTLGADAPPEAVDSRAATGGIPDEALHRTTIAEAILEGRPAIVVFATPVYCVSEFCGPITDMIQELDEDYGDRAEFIHVEIWRDFQGQVINRAAAEWLLHDGELQEPWVFAIDADGVIAERWDNVATRQEIEPWLEQLP